MNGLSWLLYFADIAEKLTGVAHFVIWAVGIVGFITAFVTVMCYATEDFDYRIVINAIPRKSLTTAILISALVIAFVPSKDTIYLIAASEMGEEAINTDAAKKVASYLDKLLSDLVE